MALKLDVQMYSSLQKSAAGKKNGSREGLRLPSASPLLGIEASGTLHHMERSSTMVSAVMSLPAMHPKHVVVSENSR
jgi:hypothetical protein